MTKLHVRGSGGTGDNLDQLVGNDGLASTVVENLELANHLTGVLGGVLWGGKSRVSETGMQELVCDK